MYIRKILLIVVSFFSIQMINAEEMIEYLNEWFEDRPYEQYGTCEDVRELKYPSQRFIHVLKMEITGDAIVKERKWWMFDLETTLKLNHCTELILAEEVLASSNLNEGIIKSEFRVQLINETLGHVGASHKALGLSTNEIFSEIKTWSERVPDALKYLTLIGWGTLWIENEKNVNSHGEIVISKETLSKNLPEYKNLVAKIRNFRGVNVTTTWELGKGYTSIIFNDGAKEKMGEATVNAIAKLIYRTNPISIKEILPDGTSQGDYWSIDANTIGGIVFDLGLDFDDVEGQIEVIYQKDKYQKFEDEMSLLNKQLICSKHIAILKDDDNELCLKKYGINKGTVIKFSPFGKFYIIDEADTSGRRIFYLKEAEIKGKLNSKINNKYKHSLLKPVEFKQADLDIQINYTQLRKN